MRGHGRALLLGWLGVMSRPLVVQSGDDLDLLRVSDAALKTGSDCSFTTRKLRVLARFRLASL